MMKSIIIVLVVYAAFIDNEKVSAQDWKVEQRGDGREVPVVNHELSTEEVGRLKRAGGDPFLEYHSKMTLAARIFSGIALRVGLYDGSVSGDKVVSELLNLDPSLQLDDVANYDKAKVDQLFSDLAGLDLSPTSGLKEIEDKIKTLDSTKKQYEKIVNPDETQSINAYMDRVSTFHDANVDFTFLTNLGNMVTGVLSLLNTIASGHAATITENNWKGLAEDLDSISKLPTQFDDLLTSLDAYKDLLGNDFLDTTIFRDVQLIQKFFEGVTKKIPDNDLTDLRNQLTLISGLAAQFDAAAPSIRATVSVLQSMTSPRTPSGFVNGFPDVLQLSNDVHDTWLPTAIDKYDKELIRSELQPLEKFRTTFTALDSKWKALRGSAVSETVGAVSSLFDLSRSPSVDAAVTAMESKDAPSNDNLKVYGLVESIVNFRKVLSTVMSELTAIRESADTAQLAELTKFKEKINFENGRKKDDVVRDVPVEDVKKLIVVLNKLKPNITEIEQTLTGTNTQISNPLTSLPAKIESERGAVDTFLSDQTKTALFQYFDFVKTIEPQLTTLHNAFTLIQTIRSMKSDANFQPTLAGITDKIAGSVNDFKALRAAPDAVNSTTTLRVDELYQLKSIDGAAKTLGEAVTVLDTAQKVLSQKTDIEQLMVKGWMVDAEIASKANKEQLANDWGSFAQLSSDLNALLTELDTKKSVLTLPVRLKRQTTTLKDLAAKLANLVGLHDIAIDLQPRIAVLRQLTSLADAAQMQSTMEVLAALDLKFSAHQAALGSVGQQVGTAEALFGAIIKPTPPGGSGTPQPGDAPGGPHDKNGADARTWYSSKSSKCPSINDYKKKNVVTFSLAAICALEGTFLIFVALSWMCGKNKIITKLEARRAAKEAKKRNEAPPDNTPDADPPVVPVTPEPPATSGSQPVSDPTTNPTPEKKKKRTSGAKQKKRASSGQDNVKFDNEQFADAIYSYFIKYMANPWRQKVSEQKKGNSSSPPNNIARRRLLRARRVLTST